MILVKLVHSHSHKCNGTNNCHNFFRCSGSRPWFPLFRFSVSGKNFHSGASLELSIKTTLLLALASAKRIVNLHAFSVNSDCIRFGPRDCSVTLWPRLGYVPKSLSTPFRMQTVSLSSLATEPSPSQSANAQTAVCPVRALRIYIDRSASFRQSDHLFVCYGGCTKGRAVSKQRLSHWIVDAFTEAYASQGLENALCTSEAIQRGLSLPPRRGQEVCLFKIFAWQPAGLCRIPSPGFTSWTFSP